MLESSLTRRAMLAAAASPLLARVADAAPRAKSIRSCILIFYYGGPTPLDPFAPKPTAPAEIRGQYRTIATSVPGIRVCEHLPNTARILDRLALVRSLH